MNENGDEADAGGGSDVGGSGGAAGDGQGGDGSGATGGGEAGFSGDGAGGGMSGSAGTSGAAGAGGEAGQSSTGGTAGANGGAAGSMSGAGGAAGTMGGAGGQSGSGMAGTMGGAGGQGGSGGGAGTNGGGAGGTGAVGALYFEDFEDGVADGWMQTNTTTGTWGVSADGANHVFRQSMQPTSVVWVVHATPVWTDLRVQARIRILQEFGTTGAGRLHLAARFTDADNTYRATVRLNGSARITRDSSDDLFEAPVSISIGTWHTLALTVVGNTLSLEYDGTSLGSAVDSSAPLPAAGIAFGASQVTVEVDDVVVTAP